MAAESQDQPVPEISEQIHLPGPSYIPVALAFGVTIAVVGVVLSWAIFAMGMIIFLVCLIRWIQDTRRDIAELPLEH